ncbi:hypothetical protein [Halorubrum trapanicum]|uniref:hypothetical protein n=1 Tax=Halorubrum trapanicum TaxID=29284 RepID=UPI0012FE59A8|nr:hypothetical protein [Halorubrum trapanicum]
MTELAQFSVTPIIEDPQLDRGEDLYLSIYFSGNGEIDHNKLHIQFPLDDVFKQGGSEFVETVEDNYNINVNRESASDVGYSIRLSDAHFEYDESSDSPEEFGRIGGERNHGYNPPLLVRLKTKDDARPGDYTIPITFTYQDTEGNIGQDYKESSFHVKSWQEENSAMLKIIAGLAAIFTVLSIIIGPILDGIAFLYQLIDFAISFYSGILDQFHLF